MTELDFRQVLRGGAILLSPASETKHDIIVELVDAMAKKGLVRDRDVTLKAVFDRESTMSTGMQHGVAIPHAKTETVDKLATAVAIKKDGIEFDSLDGLPARIFIMTISSVLRAGPHMRYLAKIGKLLERPSVRDRVLKATTEEELIEALTEDNDDPGAC